MASSFSQIIADRRDGRSHSQEDLRLLACGAADGSIPDYQLAAWLMAAYLNPLTPKETAWLTLAMADSGERIDLTGIPKPWVDKHSTGGVGDKTSLVVLPMLAACGLTVIKMSGRGLGITGGTVDKLSSIAGFRLDLSPKEMKAQASRIGIALTGQSPRLAPADKALYALRDVTETVSSVPLIVSSILSKKIAGGAEVIVLDVKCGAGAFMRDMNSARRLAQALADTAKRCGLRIRIVISDMSQPLGSAVGNALEVREALDVLDPAHRPRLAGPTIRFRRHCLEIVTIALEASGKAANADEARTLAVSVLDSGEAMRKCADWFVAQGGSDPRSDSFALPGAGVVRRVHSSRGGYVRQVRADLIGQAVLEMGGGRVKKDDAIDLSVGVDLAVGVGDPVKPGDLLFTVHANTKAWAAKSEAAIAGAFEFGQGPVEPIAPILDVL